MVRRLLLRWFVVVSLSLVTGLVLPAGGQGQPATGKKYALVVGVRDYDSAKFDALQFTENDAEELAKVLNKKGGFSVRLLTTTRGKKVPNARPTLANLAAEIAALLADKKRDDTVLVALSGHGVQVEVKDRDESFFCPSDAQLNSASKLLSLGKLFKDLDGCGAGVKLLLVDACRNDPTKGRNVDVDLLPKLPRGTAALFSCKSGERAFETPKLGHGVFFYHVLQGLNGKAKNDTGEVTWLRLADYVANAVSHDVPRLIGGGAKQTPELKVNFTGGSPVLVASSASTPARKDPPAKQPLVKTGSPAKSEPATASSDKLQARMKTASIRDLISNLKDKDREVRIAAASELIDREKEAKPAVSALTEALKDSDSTFRQLAVLALASIGPDAKAALPALKALLKDKDKAVAIRAGIAVRRIERK